MGVNVGDTVIEDGLVSALLQSGDNNMLANNSDVIVEVLRTVFLFFISIVSIINDVWQNQ